MPTLVVAGVAPNLGGVNDLFASLDALIYDHNVPPTSATEHNGVYHGRADEAIWNAARPANLRSYCWYSGVGAKDDSFPFLSDALALAGICSRSCALP